MLGVCECVLEVWSQTSSSQSETTSTPSSVLQDRTDTCAMLSPEECLKIEQEENERKKAKKAKAAKVEEAKQAE